MKKALKITGLTIAVLFTILIAFAIVIYAITQQHWNTTYELSDEPVEISNGPGVLEHGRHLLTIRGCFDCHGENLAGKIFLEDPVVGRIVATNLTAGEGGVSRDYSDEDLVRAIRKGVRKDGKSVLFMPSHEYAMIHQKDLDAMVSYIRNIEPVDNNLPEHKINLPMRAMYLIGGDITLFPARVIDQTSPIPLDEPATVRETGQYLSTTCIGCHGKNFSGGKIPGVPPNWPDASNLTPAGSMAEWSESDFFTAMREGITPDGRHLQNEFMPYEMVGEMTDEELHALFVYIKSIEPVETGIR
ncbi:MAG: cytochrome c [Balneolaceae bacterium]